MKSKLNKPTKEFSGLRHGEVLLKPVTSIPKGGTRKEGKEYIIAHSETGHNHVLEGTAFDVTEFDDGQIFVNVKNDTALVHRKTHDRHRTLTIPPSILERYHMVEYSPASEAIRVVKD